MALRAFRETYDPSEPRVPSGHEGGGRWTFKHAPPGGWQKIADDARALAHDVNTRFKSESTTLTRDLDAAMAEAEQFVSMRDWYSRHRALAKSLFGEYEPLFEKFLAATSAGQTGAPNVDEALKAMEHYLIGGRFDDGSYKPGGLYAQSTLSNLKHIQNREPLSGGKVPDFFQNLMGNWKYVTGDRHMARLIFQRARDWGKKEGYSMSRGEHEVMRAVVTAFADRIGWEPAELQAALWAVQLARSNPEIQYVVEPPSRSIKKKGNKNKIWDYQQFLVERAAGIRAIMTKIRSLPQRVAEAERASLEQLVQVYLNGAILLGLVSALKKHLGDEPSVDDVRGLLQ